MFKAAGLVALYEVMNLLTGLDISLVDIFVHRPTPVSPGSGVPIAYDVKITSAVRNDSLKVGARKRKALADAAERCKLSDLASKVASVPNDSQPNERCLDW